MRLLLRLVLLAALVIPVACGDIAAQGGPPEINFGRDICIECGMIIDDPRFAAAYRLEDGTEFKFDDLGGLILTGREQGVLDTAEVWVSDFDDEVFIDAAAAFYVPTIGVASPMGHGLVAFSDKQRAEEFAHELDGEVIEWETVKQLPASSGLVGHHHGEMEGMDDEEADHSDHEGDG